MTATASVGSVLDAGIDPGDLVGTLLVADRDGTAQRLVDGALVGRPDEPDLLRAAGLLARRAGRLDEAARRYATVADRYPGDADAAMLARSLRPVRPGDLGDQTGQAQPTTALGDADLAGPGGPSTGPIVPMPIVVVDDVLSPPGALASCARAVPRVFGDARAEGGLLGVQAHQAWSGPPAGPGLRAGRLSAALLAIVIHG